MSSSDNNLPQTWKRPDELIRLQRLKQRKKQLAARVNQNNNIEKTLSENDKAKLLEAKISQKRKNPFAKSTEISKKTKTDDIHPEYSEDSLFDFVNKSSSCKQSALEKLPAKEVPATTGLRALDSTSFTQLLQQVAIDNDVNDAEEQKFSKFLPMDWSIKTRLRFFCSSDLPSTTLKTSQVASSLTSFVRCIDVQNCSNGLDISPATRFNQGVYYWQQPYIPWMTLFPRNAKENIGITIGDRERNAMIADWDHSFHGIFQLLRARQCPYFYLCANTFTVLFRAAGIGGHEEMHALMSPTSRGIRSAMKQEGIEFSLPLKKADELNKSSDGNNFEDSSVTTECKNNTNTEQMEEEDDEEDDEWLESLGVDEKEIRKIKTSDKRKIKAKEMSDDFSDNSLVLIEGIECHGFFSFLLNAKSSICNVGRLAGIPPTILSPVAFPKATIQELKTRTTMVRMDGTDYHSIEVKGIILPTFLPYACDLIGETRDTFSATMATCNITLAFSKASQKLVEVPQKSDEMENYDAEQVFEQENLSDCGLLPRVIESMCRTGTNAVYLLERLSYEKNFGYTFS